MNHRPQATPPRQRVVIVGPGFAGVHAARRLTRLAGHRVEVTLINPADYFLYLPLLPEVTAGILDPRRIAVSLRIACPGARLLPGTVTEADLEARRIEVTDPEGGRRTVGYDRLLLTAGSVSKLLPVPGVAGHAHGFRSIAEALYLRDHLLRQLGLPLAGGRLTVDEFLSVPGHREVFSCGDVAAVPDLTRPGQITGMTAQHAVRQGKLAARNIAASLGIGHARAYRHRDLGFVVDLAGVKAAADPLGVPLAGWPAKLVTRGYHLLSLPANRVRVAGDWALDAVLSRQSVQLGLVRGGAVPLSVTAAAASRDLAAVSGGAA